MFAIPLYFFSNANKRETSASQATDFLFPWEHNLRITLSQDNSARRGFLPRSARTWVQACRSQCRVASVLPLRTQSGGFRIITIYSTAQEAET